MKSISRLSSLLRFCFKWFSILAIMLVFILLVAGYIFFNKFGRHGGVVSWQIPWIILSISTASSLMLSPIFAFLEGLGRVKDVARIRLFQQVIQLLSLIIFLTLGLKLLASPLAAVITFTVAFFWMLLPTQKSVLKFIWSQLREWRVDYKSELLPYQWRIALSWISGYFIFQLFNPVLFSVEGPTVAGQMGMSLAALNGILAVSLSWINTKVPMFSSLIANREFLTLDKFFNKALFQSSLICVFCLITFVVVILGVKNWDEALGDRFLPMFPLLFLCLTTFINQFVSALATYLRCHKKEPFLIQSVVMGLMTAASTLILGRLFGVEGIVLGYFFLSLFGGLVWGILIFRKNKRLWHL